MYDMVESIVGKLLLSSLFFTKMKLNTKRVTIQPVCIHGGLPKECPSLWRSQSFEGGVKVDRQAFNMMPSSFFSRQIKYLGVDPYEVGQQICFQRIYNGYV